MNPIVRSAAAAAAAAVEAPPDRTIERDVDGKGFIPSDWEGGTGKKCALPLPNETSPAFLPLARHTCAKSSPRTNFARRKEQSVDVTLRHFVLLSLGSNFL